MTTNYKEIPITPPHLRTDFLDIHKNPNKISNYFQTLEGINSMKTPYQTQDLHETVVITLFQQILSATGIAKLDEIMKLKLTLPSYYKWNNIGQDIYDCDKINDDIVEGLKAELYYLYCYRDSKNITSYSIFIPPLTIRNFEKTTLFTFLVYWYTVVRPIYNDLLEYHEHKLNLLLYNLRLADTEVNIFQDLTNLNNIIHTIDVDYKVTMTISSLAILHSELMFSLNLYDDTEGTNICVHTNNTLFPL
jgi:hypothetical protein